MEPRCLLSASPIHVGLVYYEEASGFDEQGDIFELTFTGGAEGTQLRQLSIECDKLGDGLTIGDTFFDTAPGGNGAFGAVPLSVVSQSGIDAISYEVEDGSTTLTFRFEGFDAGDRLVFSVDVDEMGFLGPNALAEGNEIEGSRLETTFEAPHYYQATGSDIFIDDFDAKLSQTGLALPNDDYVPPDATPHPVRTAAAVLSLEQQPLPASISGTVFVDPNLNVIQDAGEQPIAGVELTLLQHDGNGYVPTGRTAVTDQNGEYRFDNLLPGRYRVVEAQPSGYLSVGARAGQVDGATRGIVVDDDTIGDIDLQGGEDSRGNDFAEVLPAAISGHVYHDRNDNGLREAGEEGIAGATITLIRSADAHRSQQTYQVVTSPDGSWAFTGLFPGQYEVREIQPSGYLDGKDTAGSEGGTAINPGDAIVDIALASGAVGIDYDFGELLPASISGHVLVDQDGDCRADPGEKMLAGVTIELLDSQGKVVATTQTDDSGRYAFTGLAPGVYGVHELQPEGYFDGGDHVGSEGGSLLPPDSIVEIPLASGAAGENYDFCEILPARLSGYVYEDTNINGVRNPGEIGIAGVTLKLLDADGHDTGLRATTDAAGYFLFENLQPGTYTLVEEQPSGYFDGTDEAGTAGGNAINPGDRIELIELAPGSFGKNYLFGEYKPVSISGRVFADYDANGRFDHNDRPIAEVRIQLLDESGNAVAETRTDAAGTYRFDRLQPGRYGVAEIQPEGFLDGDDFVGSAGGMLDGNDRIVDVKLPPGTNAERYDFSEIPPAKISGYVYQDGPVIRYGFGEQPPDVFALRDGTLTQDDTPIPGVEIHLGDASGLPVLDEHGKPMVTWTDENGYYEFDGLKPGVYTILEMHPDGFVDGPDTPGTLGGLAVNPDEDLGTLDLKQLAVDPKNDAILRVTVTPGSSGEYYNFAEVKLDSTPPYIPPEIPPTPPIPRPPTITYPTEAPPVLAISPVAVEPLRLPILGGSSSIVTYTWHLSVIDGGMPRHPQSGQIVRDVRGTYFQPATWQGVSMDRGRWIIEGRGEQQEVTLGTEGAVPVAGDFNGDGVAEVGVYLAGSWFLDLDGNGVWEEHDLWAKLGKDGDIPVVGDWDGDGKTDIGVYGRAWPGDEHALRFEPGIPDVQNRLSIRPKNLPPAPEEAASRLRVMKRGTDPHARADVVDHVFRYGRENDRPVTGDWNGDGITTIGVFRDGTWYLDVDGDGRWSEADRVVPHFGEPGDRPVTGDWNGDGRTDLGLYRDGTFLLDVNADEAIDSFDRVFAMGTADDLPFAADFDGDGIDEVGVFRYRMPGDVAANTEAPAAEGTSAEGARPRTAWRPGSGAGRVSAPVPATDSIAAPQAE
ncbi:hypothetical protein JCM19992_11790 [Thermostilla marina]